MSITPAPSSAAPRGAADPTPGERSLLPQMTTPATPAEQLLLLGADFTRHNDARDRLRLNDSGFSPSTALIHQANSTQHLARSALDIAETLNAQRIYRSPVIRAVYTRVRQLAHLATDAADRLLDASNILANASYAVASRGEDALPAYWKP